MENNKPFFSTEEISYYPFHVCEALRIIYVIKGSIQINNVSGSTFLNDSDIEFLNIDEPTEIIALTDDNIIVTLTIPMETLAELGETYLHAVYNAMSVQFFPKDERNTNEINLKNIRSLKTIFLDLYQHYLKTSHIDEKNLNVLLKMIIKCFNDITKHFFIKNHVDENIIERFCRLEDYLIDNLSHRIKLTDFAATEFLSPQYLSAEFKNKFGITFGEMLEYYRVRSAVNMMIQRKSKTQELIAETGFSDSKYFYRAFQRHMLCTPSEFRKKISNNRTIITKYYKEDAPELLNYIIGKLAVDIPPLNNIPWIASLELQKYSDNIFMGKPYLIGNTIQRFCLVINSEKINIQVTSPEEWMFHDGDGIKIHDLGLESGILGKIGIEGSLTPMIHLESSTYTVEFLDNKYGFSLFSRLLPI